VVLREQFNELKDREESILGNGGGELIKQTRWVQVGTVSSFPQDG